MKSTLILIRHGESQWNVDNRFTGWVDVPLTEKGVAEAKQGGALLRDGGYAVDVAHTSLLRRANATLHHVLDVMDRLWIPVHKSWRLNERHYGALQGLNKAETAAKHGDAQVQLWRRSYDVRPPVVEPGSEHHPAGDPKYAGLAPDLMPGGECLKDTVERMLPYWYDAIVPDLLQGKVTLVTAHGNSLRALVKHLDKVSEADITGLNIPTGVPLVYELDEALQPTSRAYLGDADAVKKAQDAVAAQASKGGA